MKEYQGATAGAGRSFAIIVSRFNDVVTERLVEGARDALLQNGVADDDIDLYRVPGAWELPGAARKVAALRRHAAIIALGCVIRGETPHFDYVAGHASDGLGRVSVEADVPVLFGVLTTDTAEQALARAGGDVGNKGWDAALAALEMADLVDQMERDS